MEPGVTRKRIAEKIISSIGIRDENLILLIFELELSALNWMTIRDLLEFAGSDGDETLVVVLMALFSELENGSLCLEICPDHFGKIFPTRFSKAADSIPNRFIKGFSQGSYAALIASPGRPFKPLVVVEDGVKPLLYFQRYFLYEKRLKAHVEKLIEAADQLSTDDSRADKIITELYTDARVVRTGADNRPIAADNEQIIGLRMVMNTGLGIISGGPGTGKTSLMVNILRCLVRIGIAPDQIILGAPTGRAAQRMTDAVRDTILSIRKPSDSDRKLLSVSGNTIHKILRYQRDNRCFNYRKGNPLPAGAVIIDEVSMIDVVMLESLMQAIEPGTTRLVLMGDKDQLPSVEAGTVFAGMIPDGREAHIMAERLVVLKKVYRSGRGLKTLAEAVNRGLLPAVNSQDMRTSLTGGEDSWTLVPAVTPDQLQQNILQWADRYYSDRYADRGEEGYRAMVDRATAFSQEELTGSHSGRQLLAGLFVTAGKARILTFLRRGLFGSEDINRIIQAYFMQTGQTVTPPGAVVFPGELIMIARNDYRLELYNGDTGIVLKDAQDRLQAFFYRSGKVIAYPLELLPAWEPAFGMTVHKSQGSEFDNVMLVLPPDSENRILSREILYTGITRARKRVVICGTRGALNTALARKIERKSGLHW